jgi:chromosome segregation ATPase
LAPPAYRYEQGITLAGVLYFHRISDFKMGGTSTKNFKMFRKLCGDNSLQNVVIVTSMWEKVGIQVGEAREAELTREDFFFKPVLDKGAQMARHDNTVSSAKNIIRRIIDNHPLPLQIQRELVDEYKNISETGASEELNRELNAQIRKHQQEMLMIKEVMKQAMDDKEEETRRRLEIEIQRMQEEIARFANDAERLTSDYESEKHRLEARLTEVEGETMREAERAAAQYQKQIDELRNTLESSTAASEREKTQMRERINQLSGM